MYPSDYGYSVLSSSCARTTNLSSYSSDACAEKAGYMEKDMNGQCRLIRLAPTMSSV